MRHEYGQGLAYGPESLKSLQDVFDRSWQSYVSVGLSEAAEPNSDQLRDSLARSIFRAAAEGVPVQQIEGRVLHGLSDHLYAAVLAL